MTAYDDLFAALHGIPDLPGARCAGHAELWDEYTDPGITEWTVEQCLYRCPALTACSQWLATLKPSQRPRGVVAGRIVGEPKPRKKSA